MDFETIRAELEAQDQSHVLRFWKQLSAEEQASFLAQMRTVKISELNNLFIRAQDSLVTLQETLDDKLEPIPASQCGSEEASSEAVLENYRNQGLQEIANGKVAVLLMAGGQGTRLGVDYPKGMYSVGLPSGKTLFQIQAERILRLQNLAEEKTGRGSPGRIPWYIMTSGPTNEATRKYLEKNNFFGLHPEDVIIFKQGLLPCFDFSGKVLLERKNALALAPDGNGGIYRALAENAILEDLAARGIKYVHVHSVDNILVKVADPVFIGYCVEKNADCGAKVVKKDGPTEAVGVVCQVDGRFQVVEYSEITEETARRTDEQGNLLFNAGNICNHFFTVEFLERIALKHEAKLKLHVAKKKVAHVDADGAVVKPSQPQAIKIEKFVFDVFEFSQNFVTWEVPRGNEFSALKNGCEVKKDCPITAREDLLRLHKRYLESNGARVLTDEIEISPLLSYDGENLEFVRGKVFDKPQFLDENSLNNN